MGGTVRLRERNVEVHIFNKDLAEIKPAGRMYGVVFWELPLGKYLSLRIEKMYGYEIECLSIENTAGATSINRTPLAYIRFPNELVNKNREFFDYIIITLMRQLQSIC